MTRIHTTGRDAWNEPRERGRMGIATISTPRKSGYVTQALINRHGSYSAALAWLNANSEAQRA